ncbi:hypothetical protein AALD22_22330 [Lachnospiraceae bacterium 56-18]|jgi:transcription elongation factor Elf1
MSVKGYTVLKCTKCGALNVVRESRIDGYIHSDMQSFAYGVYCTECGSELEIVGPAILQEDSASDITVEVNVERRALDRMIEDVAAVHKEINEMSDKMKLIRGADSVY